MVPYLWTSAKTTSTCTLELGMLLWKIYHLSVSEKLSIFSTSQQILYADSSKIKITGLKNLRCRFKGFTWNSNQTSKNSLSATWFGSQWIVPVNKFIWTLNCGPRQSLLPPFRALMWKFIWHCCSTGCNETKFMETVVDKVYFRQVLIRDKDFLYQLYKGNKLQNRNKISGASNLHLNTLCQILHLIVNNVIKVDHESGEKIKSAKRLPFLKHNFKSHHKFTEIYDSPQENKVKILRQLSSVYCFLLEPLFER